mmetsp:Transcript_51722/g.133493  ORF Transcript_51722/g.133493 Transcript_51722/m.133493 type:complete len:231 (+) Transcript_51722:258-950(+)
MLSSVLVAKYRLLEPPEGAPKVVNAQYLPGPGVRYELGNSVVRCFFRLDKLACLTARENLCGIVLEPHSPIVVAILDSSPASRRRSVTSPSLRLLDGDTSGQRTVLCVPGPGTQAVKRFCLSIYVSRTLSFVRDKHSEPWEYRGPAAPVGMASHLSVQSLKAGAEVARGRLVPNGGCVASARAPVILALRCSRWLCREPRERPAAPWGEGRGRCRGWEARGGRRLPLEPK